MTAAARTGMPTRNSEQHRDAFLDVGAKALAALKTALLSYASRRADVVLGAGFEPGACRADRAKHTLGLFERADQQQTPSLNIDCMRHIEAIPVRFEHRPRFLEGLARQLRLRDRSANSASATMHRARATASLGPNGARLS